MPRTKLNGEVLGQLIEAKRDNKTRRSVEKLDQAYRGDYLIPQGVDPSTIAKQVELVAQGKAKILWTKMFPDDGTRSTLMAVAKMIKKAKAHLFKQIVIHNGPTDDFEGIMYVVGIKD